MFIGNGAVYGGVIYTENWSQGFTMQFIETLLKVIIEYRYSSHN